VSPSSIPKEIVEGVNVPEVLGMLRRATEKARIIIAMWENEDIENVDDLIDEANMVSDCLDTRSVELRMLKNKGLYRTLARVSKVQKKLENVTLDLLAVRFQRMQRAGNTSSPRLTCSGAWVEGLANVSLSQPSECASSHGPNPSETDESVVHDPALPLEPVVRVQAHTEAPAFHMSDENLHRLADLIVRGSNTISPADAAHQGQSGTAP
jgi:hypothetical protein